MSVISLFVATFFVVFAMFNSTKDWQSTIIFNILPFFSGFYILLSQFNLHELYFPVVFGGIGIYFLIFSFMMKTKNFQSKIIYNILPFLSGIFLVLKCLRDINLI